MPSLIADFHLHSKYSRATSRDMDLEHINKWCQKKGIGLVGTADFTHPEWFKELKEKLEPLGNGLYQLKTPITNHQSPVYFILTTEISCIYSKAGKIRRIHLVIFAPSLEVIEKINTHLGWIGNLKADGRPILGLDAKELLKIISDISEECLVVPSHIWTPWFALFGSNSGFDSVEECFEELTPNIYALETGLSSDPAMNWRLSSLDKYTLISCSDAHSLANLGREANVFEGKNIDYKSILESLKNKGQGENLKLIYTIEFFPEEGKYHFDGHRECGISFSPQETKKHKNICPKCKKLLTVGVMNRVEELADRKEGFKPENSIPFKSLVPLEEIIAESLGITKGTKGVKEEYEKLIKQGENEFNILLNLSKEELEKLTQPKIVEGIIRVRQRKVKISPGYDGVYGKVQVFDNKENLAKQAKLF